MKKNQNSIKTLIYIILIWGVIISSCNNQEKGESKNNIDSLFNIYSNGNIKNNFSYKIDTTYRINSTQIESINRTFFMAGDTFEIYSNPYKIIEDEYLELNKEVGKNEYTMIIYTGKKMGLEYFSEKELIKFFANADTVFQNPTKGLQYIFGKDERGIMRLLGHELHILITGAGTVSRNTSRAELDSMKSCFIRFKEEKIK